MKDFSRDKIRLGIVGAGVMGRGIAQIAATAGINVILNDVESSVCEDANDFIKKMLDRSVEKGKLSITEADAAKSNITISTKLEDLAACDVVVEAIVEDLDIKKSLFNKLESIVNDDCILATNTSSLSVTSIAAGCKHPGRVAGFHFFNPVPLMKLVEVIEGVRSKVEVINQLSLLASRCGHHIVNVNDSPGFLVNHSGRGLVTEGLRLLYENVTDAITVDTVMRDCAGFRMGPFELMDLIGLDVTFPATEQIYQQFFQEPRLRPTPLQQRRFAAGLLGRKSGEGFYRYENNEKVLPVVLNDSVVEIKSSFWLTNNCDPLLREKVQEMLKSTDCKIDTSDKADQDSIAIVMPLGWDISTAVRLEGLSPERTIGIEPLFNHDKRIVLMTNPATSQEVIDESRTMLSNTDRSISIIRDSAGFIAQRVISTIINIACDIAQQGIAKPEDIDKGVKLGLGYPQGPLEMGNSIGPELILIILENMLECYGDNRYRPSPWLKRRAQLGLSLLHVE